MCSFGLVHEFCASKGSAGSLGPNRSGVFARDDRPAPATTFSSSVFAKTIRHSTPAFLRAVSYNRNHSTPTVRSRSHDGNCGANAHLSPTEDQNIFPNKDALLPMVDHKNKFPPNALRL